MDEITPGLEPLTPDQTQRFAALLHNLDSVRKKKRLSAARMIRGMPPDLIFRLAEMESARARKRSRKVMRAMLVVIVVCAFALRAATETGQEAIGDFLTAIGPVCLALAAWLNFYLPYRARKTMAAIIGEQEDARFLGPALMLYGGAGTLTREREVISAILCRLLPRVRADQKELLTQEHKRLLLIPLKDPWGKWTLAIAVLKALEQIGDAWAIPIVRHLAHYGDARDHAIKNAATQCLAFLEQRDIESREVRTLLRASDRTEAFSPEVLVRAASGPVSSTPPEQLLRSHIQLD